MRRFAVAFIVAIAAVTLPMSPAAAVEPVGTVVDVASAVNERTPLYHLELVFTVNDVQCPAVVDYEMGGTTLSAPVDQCRTSPTSFFASATATTMRPMFGPGISTINPNGTTCDDGASSDGPGCQVSTIVRATDDGMQTSGQTVLHVGGVPKEVPIPPRPVWVGLGDGYTSRTTQMADWCFDETESLSAGSAATGGTVTVQTVEGAIDKYDRLVCESASAFTEEIDGVAYELWYHPDTEEYYYYDRAADRLYWDDPDDGEYDFLDAADLGVVLADLLPEPGGTAAHTTADNLQPQSWIYDVVDTFNSNYTVGDTTTSCDISLDTFDGEPDGQCPVPGTNIPCADEGDDGRCWKVVPEVVADDDLFAAHLADESDPSGQLGELEALLTSEDHVGSWNWIGLSAGLMDAGIPQAIKAAYAANDSDPTNDLSGEYTYEAIVDGGYVPWRPAGGDACPEIEPMSPAAQASVAAGVESVIAKATTWSPGLKAIVVRYPWLTEVTSSSTDELNPCAALVDGVPDNRRAILALNQAVDAGIAAAVAGVAQPDDLFTLDLATDLDLNAGFGDEPTDSVEGRQSFLQLTRPFGYPYPSDYGSATMGTKAFDSIESSGLQPPEISGTVVSAADATSASTNAEHLRNGDGWYRSPGLWVEWEAEAEEGVASLSPREALRRGTVTYFGTVVDEANQEATATLPVSWDPDAPRVTGIATGSGFNTSTGWWLSAPTVVWTADDDLNRLQYTGSPSGVASTPSPTTGVADGQSRVVISGIATDRAGNTGTGTLTLNVDTVAPNVTRSITATTAAGSIAVPEGTWTNATSASVTWNVTDATSGVRSLADEVVKGSPVPFTSTPVTAEGRTAVTRVSTDVAGHVVNGTIDVLLDRTKPRITIPGVPKPGSGDETYEGKAIVDVDDVDDVLDEVQDEGCDVTNYKPPSVNESSPIVSRTGPALVTSPGTGGLLYTFTCTARDAAGNERVFSDAFFVEVDDPPTIEGEFVNPANTAGWWKTDVQIDWTATPAAGWGLHPFLGDLYDDSWSIDDETGVGTFRTTHTDEGVYLVESPTACHDPQPGARCADTITKQVKIDKTKPRVDPDTSGGTVGGGGWYKSGPVTVDWIAGDVPPASDPDVEYSGVPDTDIPATVVSQQGITTVTAPTVTDRAGNANSGSTVVKIDAKAPTITNITKVVEGAIYTFLDRPTVDQVTCTAVDEAPAPGVAVSGVDTSGCKVARVGDVPSPDPFGPPINTVTWQASVKDVATNTATKAVVTRELQFTPGMNGRMTVGGQLQTSSSYGRVQTSGTLRCNGSPNNLGVSWATGSFNLEWIDYFYCWDQGDLEGTPDAPIDSLFGIGKGTLADGRAATIEWTFKDREVPTKRSDTMRIVIKVASTGQTVLDVGGLLAGGNFQAHEAQGNGTNDNGNVNGPTGNTSNKQAATIADLAAVLPVRAKVQ